MKNKSQNVKEQQIKVILKVSEDKVIEVSGNLDTIIHKIDDIVEEDL